MSDKLNQISHTFYLQHYNICLPKQFTQPSRSKCKYSNVRTFWLRIIRQKEKEREKKNALSDSYWRFQVILCSERTRWQSVDSQLRCKCTTHRNWLLTCEMYLVNVTAGMNPKHRRIINKHTHTHDTDTVMLEINV